MSTKSRCYRSLCYADVKGTGAIEYGIHELTAPPAMPAIQYSLEWDFPSSND